MLITRIAFENVPIDMIRAYFAYFIAVVLWNNKMRKCEMRDRAGFGLCLVRNRSNCWSQILYAFHSFSRWRKLNKICQWNRDTKSLRRSEEPFSWNALFLCSCLIFLAERKSKNRTQERIKIIIKWSLATALQKPNNLHSKIIFSWLFANSDNS